MTFIFMFICGKSLNLLFTGYLGIDLATKFFSDEQKSFHL
jgi:hypothetical protein